jgi:8-oxo-dGTP diphosphatase
VPARPKLFVVGGKKWTSAGGLVFDRKGRVALVREWKREERIWTLPKGRLEPGETLEETALREVLEEAGVRGRILEYVAVVEGRRSFVHYFLMAVEAVAEPLDERVEKVRFVEVARALELVSTARDRRALRAARGAGAAVEKRRARGR